MVPYQYPEKQLPLFITNALADRQFPSMAMDATPATGSMWTTTAPALITILDAPPEQVVGEVFNVGLG